jgi:sRNA-binding protein
MSVHRKGKTSIQRRLWTRAAWFCALAVLAVVTGGGRLASRAQSPAPPAAASASFGAGAQAPEPQPSSQSGNASEAEQKKQIAVDSANLLKMAIVLKVEVGKTTKDTLSVTVIRKADAIEQLARRMKAEMKPVVGKN